MSQSVSLILPVCNQQRGLRNRALDIAEVLTDLATSFEILIIGYGSTDQSLDLAAELAREFPQIRFASRRDARDFLQAVQRGLKLTDGEIVFIHDPSLPFSPRLLRSLWELRDDDELVMARSPAGSGCLGQPLDSESASAHPPTSWLGSLQMLRRSALRELQQTSPEDPTSPEDAVSVERITRTDLIRDADPACPQPNLAARLRRLVLG